MPKLKSIYIKTNKYNPQDILNEITKQKILHPNKLRQFFPGLINTNTGEQQHLEIINYNNKTLTISWWDSTLNTEGYTVAEKHEFHWTDSKLALI